MAPQRRTLPPPNLFSNYLTTSLQGSVIQQCCVQSFKGAFHKAFWPSIKAGATYFSTHARTPTDISKEAKQLCIYIHKS